jgi:INO80 complex subunit C
VSGSVRITWTVNDEGVDTTIEASPSVLPQRKYCDITGLEVRLHIFIREHAVEDCLQAPYTDPATGLRYHDKSVYEHIRGLVCIPWLIRGIFPILIGSQNVSAAKDYLSARGVNPIVK